jgi:hypothetical protein
MIEYYYFKEIQRLVCISLEETKSFTWSGMIKFFDMSSLAPVQDEAPKVLPDWKEYFATNLMTYTVYVEEYGQEGQLPEAIEWAHERMCIWMENHEGIDR